MFPVLLSTALGCGLYLARDPGFEGSSFGHLSSLREHTTPLLRTAALGIGALLALIFALEGARQAGWADLPPQVSPFSLVLEKPHIWLLVMLLYPAISVYPQELVYRAFLFRRYAALFPSEQAMKLASALVFAWAHVIFENTIAIALCLVGGWLFASTYARTRSVVAATFEHSLYGCAVFTVGLGWYFYGGSVR